MSEIKSLQSKNEKLAEKDEKRMELFKIHVLVAKHYMTKDDFVKRMDEINNQLGRIEDKGQVKDNSLFACD